MLQAKMTRKRKAQGTTLFDFGLKKKRTENNTELETAIETAVLESHSAFQKERLKREKYHNILNKNLQKLDLTLRTDVPADGNCFFSAVEDQLIRLGLPAPSPSQLRHDLVNFLHNVVSFFVLWINWYIYNKICLSFGIISYHQI